MMSQFDFENLAALAEERHAEMVAQAQQQQMLNEAQPARPHDHNVWQWLRHAVVDPLQHIHLHGSAATRHSVQHH